MDSLDSRKQFEQVKNHIIDSMLLIGLCTGFFAYLLAYYPFGADKFGPSLYNDSISIILLIVIYLLRNRIKMKIKAVVVIVVLLALIISDVLVWGMYSMNKVMIVIIPFYALFVFRFRAAIIIYLLAISVYLLVGYLELYEQTEISIFMNRLNSFAAWVEGAFILTTVALVVVIFTKQYNTQLAKLIDNLESKNTALLDREKQLAKQYHDLSKTLSELRVNNKKISEYAFINSHLLRAPLARMLSLADLLSKNLDSEEREEFIKSFTESAVELDGVVSKINQTLEQDELSDEDTDPKSD